MKSHINNKTVHTSDFDYTKLVVCGYCKGTKVIQLQGKVHKCTYCNGKGMLERVSKGTITLNQISDNNT